MLRKNNESPLLTQENISYVLSQSNRHTQVFILFANTTGLKLSEKANLVEEKWNDEYIQYIQK